MITIGLSRASGSPKYANYERWFRASGRDDLVFVDLFVEEIAAHIDELDAIVLTGGGDIDPSVYGQPESRSVCDGIIHERDRKEASLIELAIERRLPILGICRGIQILNVHFGGTLQPDLGEPIDDRFHSKVDEQDSWHTVSVEPGSLLYRAVGTFDGSVTSSHHQAVADVATNLVVSARSSDGSIEGLEFREPEQKSWMVAVQWHPERMESDDSLSRGIREAFLLEADSASILRRTSMPLPREDEDNETSSSDSPEDARNGFELPVIGS